MSQLENLSIFEVIGVAGFVLYVVNYFLLTVNKLNSAQAAYFIINWFAATCVLIGLLNSFNLASAMIQIFWIGISSWGIYVRFGRRAGNTTDMMVKAAAT